MIDIAKLRIGDPVHYQPDHYRDNEWENGRIKEIRESNLTGVWVVYNCGGNWNDFKNYTSALTNLRDLKLGWKSEALVVDDDGVSEDDYRSQNPREVPK